MGYCRGVSGVISLAQTCIDMAAEKGLPAYSIGWFIHNPTVVQRFVSQGMIHIDGPAGIPPGVALVRAHGISDPLRKEFIDAGFILIDGTCGTVAHSQQLVRMCRKDQHVVIVGLRTHSEVVALSSVFDDEGNIVPVSVVETTGDIDKLKAFSTSQFKVVVQTTFDSAQFSTIMEELYFRYPDTILANRLCPSTKRRHDALLEMLKVVDAVLVIGGKISANTTALARLVESRKVPVWHIENEREIPEEIYSFNHVGVTAGTSTPEEDIDAIIRTLEEKSI